MTKIEIIKEELEKRITSFCSMHNVAALKKDENRMAKIDCVIGQLSNFKAFIEGVENMGDDEENISLSLLLEESAEKFSDEDAAHMWDYEGKTESDIVKAAYIAGGKKAERFLARQKNAVDAYVSLRGKRSLIAVCDNLKDFKFGEKITVQINKSL